MIQILESIEYLGSRRIPIHGIDVSPMLVEVASDRRIDMAIVTSKQYREFQYARTGDPLGFEWVEGLRANDFYVEVSSEPLSLLIWNSNEYATAVVAYRISELPSSAGPSELREQFGQPQATA